jgi:hypothetical protein
MRRRIERVLGSIALASALACGPGAGPPPDDEALQQAQAKGWSVEQAARYWLPSRVQDYFDGMDAAAPAGPGDPVDPLMDKRAVPPRELRDPVTEQSQILGRNTWMLWCGGNEGFWDWLARDSLGFIDLLKLLDSRQRSTRFASGGIINEPGQLQRGSPAEEDLGLWLDQPADERVRHWRRCYVTRFLDRTLVGATAGACSDEDVLGGFSAKYHSPYPAYGAPGGDESYEYLGDEYRSFPSPEAYYEKRYRDGPSAFVAYELRLPPPEIYGLSSGVIGLRLFPNPKFDAPARERWKAEKYYAEAERAYWEDPDLERPYRVGMSCAFCHASYHPLKPPRDLANPEVENLSGNIGAQYLRIRAVFGNLLKEDDFVYHLLDSQPPGTVDTSLIASDNINNPNTMNSVFGVPQRVALSLRLPKERLAPAAANVPSVWRNPDGKAAPDAPLDAPSPELRDRLARAGLGEEVDRSNENPRRVPRILLDGSDSIGAWGALARVYLNIGTYWEQWNRLHEPVVGFRPQRSFRIADAETHSVYWHATQLRVGPLRDYFLAATATMPLVEAGALADETPEERDHRAGRIKKELLARGRRVFARNCIVCHSSIQPPEWWAELEKQAEGGELWDHDPGGWLEKPDYVKWAADAVEQESFWRDNFLSTDFRVPVNLVGTNACRALATNGMTGQMWEDFSSASYRQLPSVGAIPFWNPYKGEKGAMEEFLPRHAPPPGAPPGGGGPGYYRVPTLLSIWATAPFLHNNSLGLFNNDPSVDGRLEAFEDAMRKLLTPKLRASASSYNGATPERLERDGGLIWRTTRESYLSIAVVRLPFLAPLREQIKRYEAGAGGPEWLSWLRKWPWVPPALLLLAAGLVLWRSRRFFWGRIVGYSALVLAVVFGALLYLMVGRFGSLRVGPIPQGTPVSLLANVYPHSGAWKLLCAVTRALAGMRRIGSEQLSPAEADSVRRHEVAEPLLEASRCPDLVMDRGHAFEWFEGMSAEDKDALIELLKTF